MEAGLKASSLSRAEYGDFCAETVKGLVSLALKRPEGREKYITVYDYIQKQRDKLSDNNGSVFALSSQLAAFCGEFFRR